MAEAARFGQRPARVRGTEESLQRTVADYLARCFPAPPAGPRWTAVLAKSIGWLPVGPVTPADLEGPRPGRVPASIIGALVYLVSSFELGRVE